jgi:hypothetical protein
MKLAVIWVAMHGIAWHSLHGMTQKKAIFTILMMIISIVSALLSLSVTVFLVFYVT